ncbi:MAG: quinolinate synthase NadA [Polyangia bacterium]|jgi:quinolinate synthase|nr:quinolinate synthase NadA [Polyangia bacterium]
MAPSLYLSVPDYTGDSLGLSRIAAASRADVIVFLGVRFMAETAKILNPERLVLLPSARGGCSLAEAVTAADVRRLREAYPGAPVVSYVNTYAEVKAETDICCTSSNAAEVVRHLRAKGLETIIFLPDEYLGSNVAAETGMRVILAGRGEGPLEGERSSDPAPAPAPGLVVWKGRCEVHERFTLKDVLAIREAHPGVVVLAHPECHPEVVQASDFSGSTTAMIRHVRSLQGGKYALLTECAMGDNIASENPGAELLRLCQIRCPHMNEVTLEDTLRALREDRFTVEVDPEIATRARASLDRMIEIG